MISSCGTSILLKDLHDVMAEIHVVVVSEKQHLVVELFHGFLKFCRILPSDFAKNDAVRGIFPRKFVSEVHRNMVLREQEIRKVVFMINVHILDGQNGETAKSQKIFHVCSFL